MISHKFDDLEKQKFYAMKLTGKLSTIINNVRINGIEETIKVV